METHLTYRLGHSAGRAWHHLDRHAANALTAAGLPAGTAKALLWGIKLIVLGALLYVAFWLAIVGIGIAVAVWNGKHPLYDDGKPEYEWRHDHMGFGLYTRDGWRIDA
jgi:hypothetical protein